MRNGFTLIELMIVVAVIGIIAAIALPSYSQYKKRVNRADVQVEMMNIAQSLESQKMVNFKYPSSATMATIYGGITYPKTGTPLFDLEFSSLTDTEWEMIAKPILGAAQAGDGSICLNDQGQKYWRKGSTTCVLSPTSNWDGR